MAVGDLDRRRRKLGLPGSREREACVKSDKGEMQSKRKSAPARRTPICMSWVAFRPVYSAASGGSLTILGLVLL